jgi:hypothetical protein
MARVRVFSGSALNDKGEPKFALVGADGIEPQTYAL